SLSRAERSGVRVGGAAAAAAAAAVIALALGGCMRIYPDPELPDIIVEWSAEAECGDDSDRVVMSLSTVGPEAEAGTRPAACRDGTARFDDVERERYRVTTRLENVAGVALGGAEEEIDLRDGLNERVFAYFGRVADSNFRVTWTFDMGASCDALSALVVI